MKKNPDLRKNEVAVRRARRSLDLVREWFAVSSALTDEQPLLDKFCGILVEEGNYPLVWVGLPAGDDQRRLRPAARAGQARGLIDHLPLAWGEGMACPSPPVAAFLTRKAVLVPDLKAEPSCASWQPAAQASALTSCLSLPLVHQDHLHGVLSVYAADPSLLLPEDQDLLAVLAASLAQCLSLLRLQAGLGRTEEHLACQVQMLNASPYAAFVHDLSGSIICVNQAACKILGFRKEELLSLNWLDLEPPEFRQHWDERRQELLARGQGVFETAQFRQDRILIPVEIHSRLIELQGKTCVVSVSLDISERRQLAEVLEECEERYRTVFDNNQVGVFRSRLSDGKFLECNDRLAQMFGYEGRDEFLRDYLPEEHAVDPGSHQHLVNSIRDGKLRDFEARFYRQNGSILWLLYSARLYPDKDHLEGVVSDITELRQAKGSLHQSEEQYRTLVEQLLGRSMLYNLERQNLSREIQREKDLSARILKNCEEGVVGFDQDFRITLWNPAMERLAGLSLNKVLGKNLFKVLPGLQEVQESSAIFGSIRHSRFLDDQQPQRLAPAGVEGFFSGSYTPLLNEAGELSGGLVLIRPRTLLRTAQKALRDQEARLAGFMTSGEDGIAVLDRELNILEVNPALENLVGSTRSWLGEKCHALVRGQEQPCHSCPALQTLATGEPAHERFFLEGSEGRTARWLEIFTYPLKDPGTGEAYGVVERLRDITSQVDTEEALEESRQRLDLLTDNLPVVVGRLYPDGSANFLDERIKQLTGYSQADFQERRILWKETIAEDDRESARRAFLQALGGDRVYVREYRIRTRDGRILWLRENGRISCDLQGRALHTDIVLQDITDSKQAEVLRPLIDSQLRHAQRMDAIGNLAGGIAHDFNNILGVMLGYTEMALMGLEEESALKRKLQQVLKAGKRGKELVSQILSFSRPTSQEKRPVRLGSLIRETLTMLRATLPATIDLKLTLTEDQDTILADPTQIHQVIINLCANAAHAMRDKGGHLELSLKPVNLDAEAAGQFHQLAAGSYLLLSVKDTGPGMDRTTVEKIFDPFFTTKKPGEGTGLGLAVVHSIVKAHEGAITVQSEVGKGSEFQVYLPRVEEAAAAVGSEADAVENGKENILFVDDEEWMVEMWQEILRALGYQVTATTSSPKALELFQARPEAYDLVITDQTMPQITGLELAQQLLALRADLPIILCTGFSEVVTPEKAKEMGIREFIMKPLSISELAGAISRVLGKETSPA